MSQENVEIVQRGFDEFQSGLARGDPGAIFDSGIVTRCRLENGRVIRMQNFLDPAEALEAARLRKWGLCDASHTLLARRLRGFPHIGGWPTADKP